MIELLKPELISAGQSCGFLDENLIIERKFVCITLARVNNTWDDVIANLLIQLVNLNIVRVSLVGIPKRIDQIRAHTKQQVTR
jgi:hypothetical protein